jgi:hypothetical protein
MVRAIRWILGAAAAGVGAPGVAGCSLLLDWTDYTGQKSLGACAGAATCAPTPIVGWAGPVALYQGPLDASVPACASGYEDQPTFLGHGGFDADAGVTTCSACSCAPGGSCSSPELSFYSDSDCSTSCSSPEPLASACVTAPSCDYFEVGPSTPTGEACTASAVTATTPSPWSIVVSACTPTSGAQAPSCGSGGICLPTPLAPQIAGFCISQPGVVACPSGPYSVHRVYYGGLADTRGCTPCACSTTSAPQCTGGEGLPYTEPSCGVPIPSSIPFLVPSHCAATSFSSELVPAGGFELYQMPTLAPATCAATSSGGEPTGSVAPTQPTTFCCTD